MPLVIDQDHVKLVGCTVVWDGITRPETNDSGVKKWNLKVVINPTSPDVMLLNQLASAKLASSEFRGVLPAGGYMPVGTAAATEFGGMFTGWAVVNAKTQRPPNVFSEDGSPLDPMQYGPLLYPGQRVDVVVSLYAYNNKSKGIAASLDGFAIITSAAAPRLEIGGAGVDVSAAFGGGAAQPGNQAAGYAAPTPNYGAVPGAAPPPPPPAGMAPPPPPPPPAVKSNGFTAAQLLAAGWTQAQVDAIP